MNNTLAWRQGITVSDATQRHLWENLRDLNDVSQETLLINLPGDISEISKSVLFEMSLRPFMRSLKDASQMHPFWLGIILIKQNNGFSRFVYKNFFRTWTSQLQSAQPLSTQRKRYIQFQPSSTLPASS